jgi:hypothetical protein
VPAEVERGGERQADPGMCRAAAVVHRGSQAEVLRRQPDADLLAGLTDHRTDHVLARLQLARGQIPLPVGEPGVLTQRHQNPIGIGEQKKNVDRVQRWSRHDLPR